MKIGIFKGHSNNSVLRTLADEIATDAEKAGYLTDLIDIAILNQEIFENIKTRLADLDIIICFNAIGIELVDSNGAYILNTVRAVAVLWFVDDPAYYYNRLIIPLNNKFIIYPNPNHAGYIDLVSPATPHRAMLCGHPEYPLYPDDVDSSDRSITLALSWHGEPLPFWEGVPGGNTRKIIEHTVSELRGERELCVYPVLEYFFKKISGVSLSELGANPTISMAICSITDYFRKLDRINLIRALGASGLPITLIGNGWENLCAEMTNIKIVKEVAYKDLHLLYLKSYVVLNMNAANGGCERAFSALASGACVLSDYSAYLDSITQNNPTVGFYDRTSCSDVAEKIEALHTKRKTHTQIHRIGPQTGQHLWRNRIAEINTFTKPGQAC